MRSSLVQRVSSGLGLVVHLLVGCGGEDLTVPDSAAGGSGGQGGAGASGVAGAGGAAGTSGTSGQGGGPAGAGQGGAGGGGAAGGGTAGAAGGAGCGAPLVACGVECVDTQTDVTHCGDCSGKCASGQQCVLGSCQGACTTLACDGVCVDPMNDSQHCGGCKVVCAKVCSQGKCADECTEGQVACDGACVDTQADATHCGGCDVSCGDGEVCFAGLCTVKCEAGKTACGGECVATATDVMHCGNCDKACVGSETCGDGVCMCQLPARDCGGSCIDAMSDSQNCGDCGKTCGDGSQCMSGVCQTVCTSTQTGCGGVCTDTKLDPKNCGMCGKACQTGQSCSQGVCANTCQAPTKQCSEGTCRDVQNDPENCGECGKTCGGKEACVAGVCKVTCKGGQNSPVDDPWGATWDGFERASTTLAMAEQTCAGIGGRLPTATELFRVSATQTASVGQTTNTSYLWSRVPTGPAGQAIVRLSDGVTSTAAVTVAEHFRCICPEERPDTFTGKSCNGPAASPCVPLPFEGGHTAADAMDRARLPRTGAIFECTESHGRVASPEEYAALIASGAPGSGQRLRASDAMSSDTDATVKWMNDASAGWTASDNVDDAALATALSFRCVGASVATAPLLPKVTSTFLGKKSRLLVDSASSSAGTWGAAYDVCTNRGGHVARVDELWRLAQDDLPGDSLLLSTSDQVGASITNGILNGWLLASIKWTGDMPRLGDAAVSWTYRTTKGPLVRCAYYPIDKPYPGPSESQCNGGCFQEVLPGTGASIWVDAQDRGPDASLEQAYATCREHGGHLASQRDLVEAIHGGLGMGQGKGLLTSDLAAGNQAAARAIVSIFTGAPGTADSDQSPTYASWSTLSTPRPYRCMWTNELR